MAKESDQTRWVGIRPTDPPETIPVSMAAAPPCTGVYPCNPATRFLTETKKRAPAISDLQAVKDTYAVTDAKANQNCTVGTSLLLPVVDDGEIWVIKTINAVNNTSMCDIQFNVFINGAFFSNCVKYSVPSLVIVDWQGTLVLKAGDRVLCYFALGGAADTIVMDALGYKIGVY